MGKRDIVVFALRTLLSKIGSKGRVPVTDILGCVVKGVAQVSRATLFHVWITILELPGLVSRGRQPSISQ